MVAVDPTGNEALTVGEVAERCGMATSAIRYYERIGLVSATRTAGGQRRFTRDALRRVAFIRAAQNAGRSLDEIRETLDSLPDNRTPTRQDWAIAGTGWRVQLDEQIAALEMLRERLDGCIGCGCLSLDTCAMYNPDDGAASLGSGPRYLLGDSASQVMEEQ